MLAAETVDVVVDDRRQVLGHGHRREARHRRRAFLGALHHLGDDRRNEERHPVGTLMQGTHEGLVARERGRKLSDAVGDLGLGEGIEHDLLAQTVQAQLAPQGVERMVRRHHLGQAEGRQPHQAGAAAPPGDVVYQLDRRPVAPVQVLRHQQERTLFGVAVQQLAHFPQHALRAHASEFAAKRLSFFRGAEPWQLQQPRRRHATQQRGRRSIIATQLGQRLQHRKVRLTGSVVLHALAARDGRAAQAAHEVLDQRGLADARLAGHPHHRPLAAAGTIPGTVQPCRSRRCGRRTTATPAAGRAHRHPAPAASPARPPAPR